MTKKAQSFLIKTALMVICLCMLALAFLTLSPKKVAIVNAEEQAQKQTTAIDLTAQESVNNLADYGWAWDNDTLTLTLDGLNLSVPSGHAITVPDGATVVLAENSVNTITAGANSYGIYLCGDLIMKSANATNKGKLIITTPYRGIGNNGITDELKNNLMSFENIDLEISAERGINTVSEVADFSLTMRSVTLKAKGTDRLVQAYNGLGNATFTIENSEVTGDGMLYTFGSADGIMNIENSVINVGRIKVGWWAAYCDLAQLNVKYSTVILGPTNTSDGVIEVGVNYAKTAIATLKDSKIISINSQSAAISVSQIPVDGQNNETARGTMTVENCTMFLAGAKDFGNLSEENAEISNSNNTTVLFPSTTNTIIAEEDGSFTLKVPQDTKVNANGYEYTVLTDSETLSFTVGSDCNMEIPAGTELKTADGSTLVSNGKLTIEPGKDPIPTEGSNITFKPNGNDNGILLEDNTDVYDYLAIANFAGAKKNLINSLERLSKYNKTECEEKIKDIDDLAAKAMSDIQNAVDADEIQGIIDSAVASINAIADEAILHEDKLHIITFDTSEGSVDAKSVDRYIDAKSIMTEIDGKPVALPTPEKSGYKFDGWYLADEQTKITTDSVIAEDITVYARWSVAINEDVYVISPFVESQVYTGEALTPLVSVSKNGQIITEGYTVVCKDNDCELINAGIHLVAVMVGDVEIGTVSFEIERATVEVPTNQTVVYNGQEQTSTFGESDKYTAVNIMKTDVGSYNVTLTLTSNYKWSDDSTGTKTVKFIIEAKEIVIDWSNMEFTYNGLVQETTSITATYKDIENQDVPLTVVFSGEFKNAGDYVFTVSFANGETNYKLPSDATKTYTIAKIEVNKPTADTTVFTYDGTAKTYTIATDDLYTVSDNLTQTNAGEYAVIVSLKDQENYKWANGNSENLTYDFNIAKATYNMSSITFENKTVKYNGEAQSIEIAGSLPNGVSVEYTNNGQTEAGVYTITATFVYDNANYNAINPIIATLTIKAVQLTSELKSEDGKQIVIITSENGFAPNVVVGLTEVDAKTVSTGESVNDNEEVALVYDITLKLGNEVVQPDGNITIKLLIPSQLKDKEFRLIHNHEGVFTDVEYTVEGDYAVFTVSQLSEFLFVQDAMANLNWIMYILGGIIGLQIIVAIICLVIIKKKGGKGGKPTGGILGAMLSMLFLRGNYVASETIAILSVLGVVVLGLGVLNVMLILTVKKACKKENKVIKLESVAETDKKTTAEIAGKVDDLAVAENEDIGIVVKDGEKVFVRINRSFTARVIQSSDETKEFYVAIKNYLLSFKDVKCRVSWRVATFSLGRVPLVKLNIRGKTLNINLALNPEDYASAKFKVFDRSSTKAYVSVPLNYKIRSNRALNNAKKLVDDIAILYNLEGCENVKPTSVEEFPFEKTKALVEKGLVKIKSISGEEITDIDNVVSKPFAIHQSVTVQEAHEEISDEVAMRLIIEGSKAATTGKKYPVNIDVLSVKYNSGDTVNIESLKEKGIVPKNESAIKILARGSLDKALTVVADAYSADAVKMIVLVGGVAKLV